MNTFSITKFKNNYQVLEIKIQLSSTKNNCQNLNSTNICQVIKLKTADIYTLLILIAKSKLNPTSSPAPSFVFSKIYYWAMFRCTIYRINIDVVNDPCKT